MMKHFRIAITLGLVFGFVVDLAAQLDSPLPKTRREALIKEARKGVKALPAIRKAADDENAIVRHTAVRLLTEQGAAAEQDLLKLLEAEDSLVRRIALQALCSLKGKELPVEVLEKASQDAELSVRLLAVSQLAAEKPVTGKRLEILTKIAMVEKVGAVRDIASNATWPFQRHTVLLRNRSDWDHEVKTVQDVLLPADNWLFALDESNVGHLKDWFAQSFDASSWKSIPIAATWESAGFAYDGIAWYRRTFKAPEKPVKYNAVELHFEAVDECAWVWLNGIYIGQHNLGTAGWTIPFSLDITKEIKWGEDNLIVVRVQDTAGAGGIYKPVHLQVLE